MWALIGLLAGALAGQALWHEWGAVLGGLAGFFIGAVLTTNRQRSAFRKPDTASAVPAASIARLPDSALADRLTRLEERIAALEQALRGVPADEPTAEPAAEASIAHADLAERPEVRPTQALPPSIAFTPPAEGVATWPDVPIAATIATSIPTPTEPFAPPLSPQAGASAAAPVSVPNPVWAWFAGGNALTWVGVVVLFFGVAFLLRYFAEHFALTIEMKLSGVALAGFVLIGLGLRLMSARPGYGLSLQGAGVGILYLTTSAASRLYGVLPDQVAMFLFMAIAALTVFLALRADSQPMAALAIAGGFLAPILAERHEAPMLLFGYFAILNGAIFALAWRHAWRALNVLGFVFTFALGFAWGARYYVPEHFATVEPFLALFVVFYVAIVILEARRSVPETGYALGGMLVFGAPLIGLALQAALVRDARYGAAWSAVALALAYGGLFLALRHRTEAGFALLAKAFLALAVILATLAIPFAFEDQSTAALWAIEAAGVYWMGIRQRSALARGFALLVELGAGAAFVWSGSAWDGEPMFGNAHFIAAMLIALSGLATAHVADRAGNALARAEERLTPLAFAWGLGCWFGAGTLELAAHFSRAEAAHATLAWVSAGVALALALQRLLAWRRLALAGVVLLPVMGWIALRDFETAHTTLEHYGWVVFPVAWLTQWIALRAMEAWAPPAKPAAGSDGPVSAGLLRIAHVISVLALAAQIAWEAGEWVGRWTPAHTAWVACASALPAILYLFVVTRWREASVWPFPVYGDAYAVAAGSPIAALLAVWFVAANVLSPGDASPFAYLPLANPLEVTLALALAALFVWARRFAPLSERVLYGWAAAALFVGLNGAVLRTAHHWGDIPWRLSSLLASKPLQAALTLTWTATALALMFMATHRRLRPLWMTGAALLAVVVAKLFLVDLGALSGLPRVVSFLGVGVLLLAIGFLSPLPPAAREDLAGANRQPR